MNVDKVVVPRIGSTVQIAGAETIEKKIQKNQHVLIKNIADFAGNYIERKELHRFVDYSDSPEDCPMKTKKWRL